MDIFGLASSLIREGAELCFPRVCAGCGRTGVEVCGGCAARLFRVPVRLSGQRVGLRPELGVWGIAPYEDPVRALVLAGKNGYSRRVRKMLVQAGIVAGARLRKLADAESSASADGIFVSPTEARLVLPDAVVVLPSHRRNGKQPLEVSAGCFAAGIAAGANLELCELLRLREGAQKQAGRGAEERYVRRSDAFEIARRPADDLTTRSPKSHPRLWLVDDVITTGSTIYFACKLLEQAGFEVVGVAAICIVNQS